MGRSVPRPAGPLRVWLVGLAVLGAATWMLLDWVERRGETAGPTGAPAPTESERREARIAARESAIAEVERISVPIALAAIVPLGPEDTGIHVTFAGTVVGGILEDGAWVRSDAGTVFVHVVDGADALDPGRPVRGRGVVRHDPARTGRWRREAEPDDGGHPAAVAGYYIETTADRLAQVPE